jgi:hypothetical protein
MWKVGFIQQGAVWKQWARAAWGGAFFLLFFNTTGARATGDELLPNALQLRVTESGLDFLQQNLEEILLANGFALRKRVVPFLDISTPKPIRLEEVSADFQGERKSLSDIAETLQEWIQGVELKNPQPRFRLNEVGYEITDSSVAKFTVKMIPQYEASQAKVASAYWGGSAVLDIRMVVPRLRLFARELTINDPLNPVLGSWTVSRPELFLGDDQTPLRFNLRVKVAGSPQGTLSFRVLGANWNLNQVPVRVAFSSLSVPKVRISVGNRTRYLLDQVTLEQAFREKLVQLARLGRSSVHSSIHGVVQASIQSWVQEWLDSEQIGSVDLDVPSVCDGFQCRKFSQNLKLGLARADIGIGELGRLGESDLRLRFFSDWKDNPSDPGFANSLRGLDSAVAALDEVSLSDFTTDVSSQTHLVTAVDPRIYNEMLQSSWDSGWRPHTADYGILAAPQVRMISLPGEDMSFLDIPLSIQPRTLVERQLFGNCGFQGATDDPFRIDAAVKLDIQRTDHAETAIDLGYRGIELSETIIDSSQFSACALSLMAHQGSLTGKQAELHSLVRRGLEGMAQSMSRQTQFVLKGLQLPSRLLGVDLRVERAEWLNGRILLHFRFAGVAEKGSE